MSIFAACRMAMAAGNAGGCAAVGTTLTTSNEMTPVSGGSSYGQIHFDPHNEDRFLYVYQTFDATTGTECAIGTVSSSGITFGSFYTVQSAQASKPSIAWNPNVENEFVVVYVSWESGSYTDTGDAKVGTITSNTVISFSSLVRFYAGGAGAPKVAFDPNSSGDLLVAYSDKDNSSRTTFVCATLSSGTLTFASTHYALPSGYEISTSSRPLAYDSQTAGKFAVVQYGSYPNYDADIVIGTISSQVITFGTRYEYRSDKAFYVGLSADPFNADKFVLASGHWQTGGVGKVGIITVSGTTPTMGSLVTYASTKGEYTDAQYSYTNEDKILITWKDNSTGYLKTVAGTVVGSTITLGTTVTPYSAAVAFPAVSWDRVACGSYVLSWRLQDGSTYYPKVLKGTIS
jgi:hypothetical protein